MFFDDLVPNEAKNFTEWLGWNKTDRGNVPFLKLFLDVSRKGENILPYDVRAGIDEKGYLLTAEAREYLKATYLKPLRDAENELVSKRNSRLSQILYSHDIFKGDESKHDLVKIFNELQKNLADYFKGTTGTFSSSGKEIKEKIDSFIKGFYDSSSEIEFSTSNVKLKEILEKLSLNLSDSINVGLGTLNRVFMSAELLHLDKPNWNGLKLGLVEELEAHIHPQAQMQVIETLRSLSKVQFILTTHSPNLASKVKLHETIICTEATDGKTKFPYLFPLSDQNTQLLKTDYRFLERFIDVTKSNLFFAKGVVFVEGISEEIILPYLAAKLNNLGIIKGSLTQRRVSVVNINSTAFNRFSRIFKRNKLPYMSTKVAIINDLDLRPEAYAIRHGIHKINYKKNKIETEFTLSDYKELKENRINGQCVKAFISSFWTLEYSIALHPFLNKILFKAILYAIEENRAEKYNGKVQNKYNINSIKDNVVNKQWSDLIKSKTKEEIAFEMMFKYIDSGKKLSKAVIASYFAEFLTELEITKEELLLKNNPIEYLINSIIYVTE